METQIKIGDKVRSFDFAHSPSNNREVGTKNACYVEGVVEDMGANACDFMPNANVYKIRATKRIFAGKEVKFEDYYYPPMNGSRSLMGEINCVDKIK
jgi:hypothetical protein